jgi:hypothetical protein
MNLMRSLNASDFFFFFFHECKWCPVAEVVEYVSFTDWVYCVVEVQIKTSYGIKFDHPLDGFPVDVGRALMPGLKTATILWPCMTSRLFLRKTTASLLN